MTSVARGLIMHILHQPPAPSMHSRLCLAVEDFRVWLPFDAQNSNESPLRTRQRVIDERIVAGHIDLELGDDGAAGGDRDGLDTL